MAAFHAPTSTDPSARLPLELFRQCIREIYEPPSHQGVGRYVVAQEAKAVNAYNDALCRAAVVSRQWHSSLQGLLGTHRQVQSIQAAVAPGAERIEVLVIDGAGPSLSSMSVLWLGHFKRLRRLAAADVIVTGADRVEHLIVSQQSWSDVIGAIPRSAHEVVAFVRDASTFSDSVSSQTFDKVVKLSLEIGDFGPVVDGQDVLACFPRLQQMRIAGAGFDELWRFFAAPGCMRFADLATVRFDNLLEDSDEPMVTLPPMVFTLPPSVSHLHFDLGQWRAFDALSFVLDDLIEALPPSPKLVKLTTSTRTNDPILRRRVDLPEHQAELRALEALCQQRGIVADLSFPTGQSQARRHVLTWQNLSACTASSRQA